MPFTPFHFGPGMLVKAAAPRYFSLLFFIAVNVAIDFETLYYMLRGAERLHCFFHTYAGASLAATGVMAVGWGLLKVARQPFSKLSTAIGSFAGAYSHVFLDSIMHADIRPLEPFSADNPLFRIISLETLHRGCLLSFVLAGIFYIPKFLKKSHAGRRPVGKD